MRRVILTILDGFGVSDNSYGNAVKIAKTPNLDRLLGIYPHSLLDASGKAVGLPEGQMGTSEVGHLAIGSGRMIYEPLEIINNAIKDGSFYTNKELLSVMEHAKKNGSKLHLLGLLSDGGIHSHINHLFELILLAKNNNVKSLFIHVFTDGRDTEYNVALKYLEKLQEFLDKIKFGSIATISGRYYAMDREECWDRVKLCYDALVYGKGTRINDYKKLVEISYEKNVYDEFILPNIVNDMGSIEENDGLIVFNFRQDRLTELFYSITNSQFDKFKTYKFKNLKLVTMMPVDMKVVSTSAFLPEQINNTLGEVLSNEGYRVLRIAETSKFPHVTKFFDGGKDMNFVNTTCIKIPKKDVPTYDVYPKMSANEVTDTIIDSINNFKYDFVVVNYANGDMVGHTGNLDAAIKAVETLDDCIGRLHEIAIKNDYLLIITADHGNCEEMLFPDGKIITTHSLNKVHFIVCDKNYKIKNGTLIDVAPTILYIINKTIPSEMNGNVLIEELL